MDRKEWAWQVFERAPDEYAFRENRLRFFSMLGYTPKEITQLKTVMHISPETVCKEGSQYFYVFFDICLREEDIYRYVIVNEVGRGLSSVLVGEKSRSLSSVGVQYYNANYVKLSFFLKDKKKELLLPSAKLYSFGIPPLIKPESLPHKSPWTRDRLLDLAGLLRVIPPQTPISEVNATLYQELDWFPAICSRPRFRPDLDITTCSETCPLNQSKEICHPPNHRWASNGHDYSMEYVSRTCYTMLRSEKERKELAKHLEKQYI